MSEKCPKRNNAHKHFAQTENNSAQITFAQYT